MPIDWQNKRVVQSLPTQGRVNWKKPEEPAPVQQPGIVKQAASKAFESTKDVISKGAGYVAPVAKATLGFIGRVFGGAVGGATGAVLEAGRQATGPFSEPKPFTERLKAIGKTALESGKQSSQFGSDVAQAPVGVVEEVAKTGKATVQGLTGNDEAFINRAAEVLQRNANMGESVIGRPFSTLEEAKQVLMSGDKKAWASAVGGMGLDLSVATGFVNKLARGAGPLEAPTGRTVEMPSTDFARRVGVRPETAPPGTVKVNEMQRTPLARATEPISKIMETKAPPKFSFNPVKQLPTGPEAPVQGRVYGVQPRPTPAQPTPAAPAIPRTLPAPQIQPRIEAPAPQVSAPPVPQQPQPTPAQEVSRETFKGFPDLSTTVLEKLKGRSSVSKQFISDLTNSAELKQTEKDVIRRALEDEGNTIDVPKFANKVKAELLPLNVKESGRTAFEARQEGKPSAKYENISLPEEVRGDVKNYKEKIYESPVETSAGDVHFKGDAPNYFGHTRIEDMADDATRRVIEVQSDLYQRGRLQSEKQKDMVNETRGGDVQTEGFKKLEQYNDPTAHLRMIREEIKKAAEDGKTKLQFPTGETAMKIEGLGDNTVWSLDNSSSAVPEELEVGKEIYRGEGDTGTDENDAWIITDVLGDGKFKAVPKRYMDDLNAKLRGEVKTFSGENLHHVGTPEGKAKYLDDLKETFDISGKANTENPIYKFYEKDVGKYLKNKYKAEIVTDENGVNWFEVNVNPKAKSEPVIAYSRILPTFKDLDSLWQKALGNRMWSSLVKVGKKAAQKAGSGEGKAAQFFRRMVAPKQFQGEEYAKLKDTLDIETQKAMDRALDFGDRLSKLTQAEQLEIVDRIVSGNYDDTKIGKLAEDVEAAFMELGQELVNQGKLSEAAFRKNYGRYFPRLYEKFEREKVTDMLNRLKGIKADLSYIKKRKDLPPEIREALGEIKEAPYPVAKRLLQEGVDIAKLKFFERVASESSLVSSEPKQGWVKLPENKRLGALSEKWVPAEIEYDINQLAHTEMRPKWLEILEKSNQIWKGVHTILDTGVVTSNMVSNIVLADFAGLPPQRLDVWGKAFFDVLNNKGAYRGMVDQGKFRHTFVRQELQGFLPEIEKFKKTDIKNMTDVAGLLANGVKKGWIKAGEVYNFLEEWSKTAVYKYLTEEKGWDPKEAADHSETWLFNYGDVPPIIDKMRKIPIGAPFVTFAYKSIPRFIESGIRMPFTWLKYIIALNLAGGGAMMLKKLGMSEDEFKKIKPKTAGDWLVYAGRKKDGTHDFIDLSRYMPFGRQLNPRQPLSFANFAKSTATSFLPTGGAWGTTKLLQVMGSLVFGTTFRDTFFDKIIFDDSEKMDQSERLTKALDYLWSDWTPNWVPTPSGQNPKSADYLRKALTGQQTVTKGVPQKYTVPEAAMRFFGTKKVEMHPTLLRDFGGADIDAKISKLKSQRKRATSPDEQKEIAQKISDLQKEKTSLFGVIGKLNKVKND